VLEFLPSPTDGRRFTGGRHVRLGDTDPQGRLRSDAAARYLQDVAGDDWDGTGIDTGDMWVVRRTAMRLTPVGRWPELGEMVEATTWCSGIGAAWAERRTDLAVDGVVLVETEALWVPLDGSGRPRRISPEFRAVYGEASGGRRISGRDVVPAVPADADHRPWPLRRADLDVAGHVNNAACWAALEDASAGPVASAVLNHHGPLEWGAAVILAMTPGRLWLLNGDLVRVSGGFTLIG
jgi:acyl-ACP thioesterase